jgi:adenosylcobinamide-GDP ribazoletransferase
MRMLKIAIGFLTVFPFSGKEEYRPGDLGRAAGWFPMIGAFLGVMIAAIYYGLSQVFPGMVAAALAVAVWVGLTGGLHLDGLADSCDGLLNASGRERRLEIMKDPRVGTFGALGLIMSVLLKFVCLSSLSFQQAWIVLPLAAGLGRWLLIWAGKQPLARPGGMGADYSVGLNPGSFWLAASTTALLAALAGFLSGWRVLGVLAAVHLIAWLIFRMAKSRLGGVTGDIFGLLVELSEVVTLLCFCIRGGL